MDSTALQIVAGLGAAGIHVTINAVRRKAFELSSTLTLVLGGAALPAACELLNCAINGDPSKLPANWRIHLTVAGVAMLWLSAKRILTELRDAWMKSHPAVAPVRAGELPVIRDPVDNAAIAVELTRTD